jgi:hypothetical protein
MTLSGNRLASHEDIATSTLEPLKWFLRTGFEFVGDLL